MDQQKKDEAGCNSGCGCCSGSKKIIFAIVLGLLVFTCGYIFGKSGHCMLGSGPKMCPITQK